MDSKAKKDELIELRKRVAKQKAKEYAIKFEQAKKNWPSLPKDYKQDPSPEKLSPESYKKGLEEGKKHWNKVSASISKKGGKRKTSKKSAKKRRHAKRGGTAIGRQCTTSSGVINCGFSSQPLELKGGKRKTSKKSAKRRPAKRKTLKKSAKRRNVKRGGYAQLATVKPWTPAYSSPVALKPSESALANPAPITHDVNFGTGSCVDNYNYYTKTGFQTQVTGGV